MSYFDTISIGWLGISSGQKAYLNLFSSLSAEIGRISEQKLVLCIDEGDLYLHPKWQIEFFSKLMRVLPAIFNGKIHLILTSHSPFLLSDLPRNNIQVLGTNSADLLADANNAPTFGANLYDLYSGPLFLGRDRSGIFSRDKITELLKIIENKKLTHFEQTYVDQFLAILGDKILKFKIENLMREKK